jgi:hypothetical protein
MDEPPRALVKRIHSPFAAWLLTLAVYSLTGRSAAQGPEIQVTWASPKAGLVPGTPLTYQRIEIGKVTATVPVVNGFAIKARLDSKYAHYVKEKTAMLFHPATNGQPAYLEVIPMVPDAPPVKDGAILRGAESRQEAWGKMLLTDWRRTALFGGAAVVAALLLLVALKLLFRLWGVLACLAAGVASAAWFSGSIEAWLRPHLAANVRVDLLAGVAAFFLGCLAASIIVGLILRPLRKAE